jgi:copper chaperone CopZ
LLPYWLQLLSGIVITISLLNIFVKFIFKKFRRKVDTQTIIKNADTMNEIKVFVRGMHCNHCKMSVENNLNQLEGINKTVADVDSETVVISGDQIDLTKVKDTVEGIGYKFGGEVA